MGRRATGGSCRSRKRHSAALVLAAALLPATACGSSHTTAELQSAYQLDAGVNGGRQFGGAGVTGDQIVGADDRVAGFNSSLGNDGSVAMDGSASGAGALARSAGNGSSAAGEEIVVASVGHYSGLAGASLVPAKVGIQVWAQDVNARGGIAGRPVRLIVVDDGSDPARHVAIVKELVEEEGVVAFVANFNPLTGQSTVDYLREKRVPVIGGSSFDPWYAISEMHFPTASAGDGAHYGAVAAVKQMADVASLSKLGVIYCAEASACADAGRQWARFGKELGMDVVYSAQSSLVQPDFTAECLAARNAGVEVFMMSMAADGNRRLSQSCDRQGFYPMYATVSLQVVPEYVDSPSLEGLAAGSTTYPWFLTGVSPARQFQAAMAEYAPGFRAGGISMEAWAAGAVLERALHLLVGPSTSAKVLSGLYTIQDDTMGGLTLPLTYEPGGPNVQRRCWWLTQVEKAKFVSPNGGQLQCA